jgi:hypothetical protein
MQLTACSSGRVRRLVATIDKLGQLVGYWLIITITKLSRVIILYVSPHIPRMHLIGNTGTVQVLVHLKKGSYVMQGSWARAQTQSTEGAISSTLLLASTSSTTS